MHLSIFLIAAAALLSSCTTVPEPRTTWHRWPKGAYLGVPERPFDKLGQVRTRIEYNSLDFENDEAKLCKNYFNKAAADLLHRAKEVGADAVIDVRAVVFQIDGKTDTFETPECSDDGVEGQVLAQAVAVKWKRGPDGKVIGGKKAIRQTVSQLKREKAGRVVAPVFAPTRPFQPRDSSTDDSSEASGGNPSSESGK